jgi:valyl-tRNA synthetase
LAFEDPAAARAVPGYLPQLDALAGLAPVEVGELPEGWRVVVAPGARVAVDVADVVDVAAERARLSKLRDAAERERAQAAAKLANPSFTERAPAAVVDKMRDRLGAAEADIARLGEQLAALPAQ